MLKNYPCLYNQLNPCSRALHWAYNQLKHCEHAGPAHVGRERRIRAAGWARERAAGAGVFKFLPNASNRLPLNVEILRNGLNVLELGTLTPKVV